MLARLPAPELGRERAASGSGGCPGTGRLAPLHGAQDAATASPNPQHPAEHLVPQFPHFPSPRRLGQPHAEPRAGEASRAANKNAKPKPGPPNLSLGPASPARPHHTTEGTHQHPQPQSGRCPCTGGNNRSRAGGDGAHSSHMGVWELTPQKPLRRKMRLKPSPPGGSQTAPLPLGSQNMGWSHHQHPIPGPGPPRGTCSGRQVPKTAPSAAQPAEHREIHGKSVNGVSLGGK